MRVFLSICLNPVIQKTIILDRLNENGVNRARSFQEHASGKGINVSRVLVQLGHNVQHITQAGGDNAELFLKMAKEDDIPVHRIDSGAPVRRCYTLLNFEKHTTTEVVEEGNLVSSDTEEAVFSRFMQLLINAHTVIISGTKAPGFSDSLFPRMVQMAKVQSKRVIIDYRGTDLLNSLQYGPDVIKPNIDEFFATFDPDGSVDRGDEHDVHGFILAKTRSLYKKHGVITILTMGGRGVIFFDGASLKRIPSRKIVPVNTTGSGDAFAAGLAAALGASESCADAVRSGIKCAVANALLVKPGSIL